MIMGGTLAVKSASHAFAVLKQRKAGTR